MRNLSVLDWQTEARQHTLVCLKEHKLPAWKHLYWTPGVWISKPVLIARGVKQSGNKGDVAAALAGVSRHWSVGSPESICLHCCHACCSHCSGITVFRCVDAAVNWCSTVLCAADGGQLEIKRAFMPSKNTRGFFGAFLLQCVYIIDLL